MESNMNATQFELHSCFDKSIVDRYDGFILDQFGVLHNGQHGLDGAPELVQALATKHNKKLVILSNSSSSSVDCKAKLPQLGFDPNHFVNAVTSGEEAGRYIRNEYSSSDSSDNKNKKKKALWFTWKSPKSPSPLRFLDLCGENIEVTADPDEADFIILHGVDVLRGQGEDGTAEISLGNFHLTGIMDQNEAHNGTTITIDSVLRRCVERDLRIVCANPDYIMVRPDGSTGYMPGTIAKRYEQLGGKCISFGKPHVSHFEACLRDLNLPKEKVAHVGDSLHHDIQGANDSGIDSIFVMGGIHRTELNCTLGNLPEKELIQGLFDKHSQVPTHVIPMFR